MNILNWNVKGLSKPKRRRLLKDLLLQHHIDIVSSQKIKRIKFKDRMLNAWR
jgi:exonuclease III